MIPKICAMAVFSAILFATLNAMGFKSAGLFSALCCLTMLSSLVEPLRDIFGSVLSIADSTGLSEAATCALKAVGLGYVFGITSDLCALLGEGGIARVVTMVGRVEIFALSYPFLEKTVALVFELLK